MPETARPAAAIVTTAFFPDPVVGSVRMTNWARMLSSAGWRVLVLTRWYGRAATPTLVRERIGDGVEVRYVNGPLAWHAVTDEDGDRASSSFAGAPAGVAHGFSVSGVKRWIATGPGASLAVPDIAASFWRGVSGRVVELVRGFGASAVVTSGPPHGVHEAGLACRVAGIGWLADFRDPFLLDHRSPTRSWALPLVIGKHRAWERRVFTSADATTHAVPVHGRVARRRFPECAARIHVLRHPVPMLPTGTDASEPSVRMVGSLTSESVGLLAEAMSRVQSERARSAMLRFSGSEPANADDVRARLGGQAMFLGALRHDAALGEVAGATVLVNALSAHRSTYCGISSKLYEYGATQAPIVECLPTRPDRELLRKLGGTRTVRTQDAGRLAEAIDWAFTADAAREAAGPIRARFQQEHGWDQHSARLIAMINSIATK